MASNIFGLGIGEKKFKLIIDTLPNFLERWKKGEITKKNIMKIILENGKEYWHKIY